LEQYFSERLSALCAAREWSTYKAAKETGIKQQTLQMWMNPPQTLGEDGEFHTAKVNPTLENLVKLAQTFGVSLDYLAGLIPEPTHTKADIAAETGLTGGVVDNLRLVQEGYFEDTPEMVAVLDYMLSDKSFYEAIEEAMEWFLKKEAASAGKQCPDCGGLLPPISKRMFGDDADLFFEWQAAQSMHGVLMDMFKQNLVGIYNSKRKGEK